MTLHYDGYKIPVGVRPTEFQMRIKLEPVALETNGIYVPIDQIDYGSDEPIIVEQK